MAEPKEEPRDDEPTDRPSEPPVGDAPDDASAAQASAEGRAEQGSGAAKRLAARRAAKQALKEARRKAAEAAEAAAPVEDEAEQVAAEATRWATRNRNALGLALLGLLIVLGGAVAWSNWRSSSMQARAAALWKGASAAAAPLVPEGVAPPLGAEETFPTTSARAAAAAERFAEAATELSGAHAAWARLGEGAAKMQLGEAAAARKAFEAARAQSEEAPHLRAGALEGLAHAAEAEAKWEEAAKHYEALGRVASGRYRPLAELGLARVEVARGEREAAIGRLKKLLSLLDGTGGEGSAAPRNLPYVRDRAEALLRSLDPSYAPAPRVLGGPGGAGGISQEQLQRLLQQIQSKQQGGATP